MTDRADRLLTFAYEELLWISEYPNRIGPLLEDDEEGAAAVQLAERARKAVYRIEAEDRD